METSQQHADLLDRFSQTTWWVTGRTAGLDRDDYHQEVWLAYLMERHRGGLAHDTHPAVVWTALRRRGVDLIRHYQGTRGTSQAIKTAHPTDPTGWSVLDSLNHDPRLDPPLSVDDLLRTLPDLPEPLPRLVRGLAHGHSKQDVAASLGVHPSAVSLHLRYLRQVLADWDPHAESV